MSIEIWTANALSRRLPGVARCVHAHNVQPQAGGAQMCSHFYVVETLVFADSIPMVFHPDRFVVDVVSICKQWYRLPLSYDLPGFLSPG